MSTPCSNRKALCSNEHWAFFGRTARERPRLAFARQRRLEQKRTPDGFLSLLSSFPKQLISAHGAGAPSPPSEEGGGCLRKGFEQADGGRDTVSMCENSRYRRALNNNDTCITLCAHTPWCKQQPHVLSPSVAPLNPLGAPALPPRRSPLVLRLFALALADGSGLPFSLHPPPAALESQPPQREPRRLPPQATELQRRVPQLSPLLAGCPHPSRRGAAPCHLPQRGRLRRLPPQSIYFPSVSALNHRKNGLSISVEHRLSSV